MKTIKPLKLSVLHRTIENDGKCFFVPTILVCFPFEAPDVGLQEVNLWKLVADELGGEQALDECNYKKQGEVLITGRAYPPGEEPQSACAVRLQIGNIDKQVYVVGDREWRNGVPTDPTPFHEMSLGWANAFGGEGFDKNPLGKGASKIVDDDTGKKHHPLPNVEDPKKLVTSPGQRPDPVGFGAIDLTWPQRMKKAGTYDKKWLEERYPGYPEDLDWTFFNVAPPDQWIEGYFEGGESFVLENMHPTERRLESRLPSLRARCFITRDSEEAEAEDEFREVNMRLDTLHLFPHHKRGIVVFRGLTEVSEDDAADIKQLVAACERPGEPRPSSHYKRVLAQRMDKEKGGLYALRDSDLFPKRDPNAPRFDDETLGDTEELLKLDNLVNENMRRKREQQLEEAREMLRAHGINPDEHVPKELPPPEEPPDTEDLVEYVEEQEKLAERAQADAKKKQEEAMASLRQQCEQTGVDLDKLIADKKADQAGPPKFSAQEELQKIADQVQLGRNAGMPMEQAEARLADPDFEQKLEDAEKRLFEVYRKYGQHFDPAARLDGDEAASVRAEVVRALAANESLAGKDLTGADLSGLDLSNADLAGAFLEAANLSNTNLSEANLADAVLVRADLTGAKLTAAKVAAANFGGATLHGTDLSGGLDLSDAVFAQAELIGTDLRGANLDKADFMDARLHDCNLSGVRAKQLLFISSEKDQGLDLSSLNMSGSELHECIFTYSNLENVDLSGASFCGSVLFASSAAGANFDGADCSNLRVVYESSMAGATFRKTKLEGANLRSSNLKGCDFSGAEMTGADLSESDLEDAIFYQAVAPKSLMMKANLKNANLTSANLMEAILQKANIDGANFQGANLFRVDFAKVKGNRTTNFEDANMKHIRFVDRNDE